MDSRNGIWKRLRGGREGTSLLAWIYVADCVRSSSIIQTPRLRKQWKLATWMAGKQVNQGSKASSDKSPSTVSQSELASHVKLTIKTFNNSILLIYDKTIIRCLIKNFFFFFNRPNYGFYKTCHALKLFFTFKKKDNPTH